MREQTGTPLVKNLGSKTVRTASEVSFYESHTIQEPRGSLQSALSAGKNSSQIKWLWQDIVFET